MTPLPTRLELVYRNRRQHPPRGVLLSGDDAGTWLRTLAMADVTLADVEFLPLPQGPADRRLRGVLAVVPGPDIERLGHAGPLYGVLAGRVYVPVDGAIEPPVAEEEWNSLLSDEESRFVWHPAAGLVRIEPEERLRAADLIRPPVRRESDWSRALPGPHLNTRLFALLVDAPPSVEEFFGTAGEDIGSSDNSLDQLPKGPNEPGAIDWRKLAGAPLRAVSGLLQWMGQKLTPRDRPGSPQGDRTRTAGDAAGRSLSGSGTGAGAGAGAGSFGAGLGSWLAGALAGGGASLGKALGGLSNVLSRLTPQIVSERAREIERLLDRFASDPDDALRYALPLTGEAGRGIAPPGWRLTRRGNIDFSLGGTSGAVDAWGIPPELQTSLLGKYREAAQREIRLGRYRRAAYIFSKLLGDHLSAASALEQGRFHREAAVLYRDKLRQPLEAARCLARGGLLREAVELYREQGRYVEAGDLLVRLEEPEEAAAQYRLAAEGRLAQSDFVGAADLLSRKLSDEDEAFSVLRRGWPDSSQAEGCLTKLLEGTARLGKHDVADDFVRALRSGDLPLSAQTIVLERLPETALKYPDPAVQADAAEGVRIVAARFLADSKRGIDLPLRAIERLVPGDRLLGRDCRRYRPAPSSATRKDESRRSTPRGDNPVCRLQRTISLTPGVTWLDFKGTAAGYVAVGITFRENTEHLVLQRGAWDGSPLGSLSWPLARRGGSGPPQILLTVEQLAKTQVRLTALSPVRDPLLIPPVFLPDMTVDTPPWLVRPGTLAADSFGLMAWTVDEALDVRTIDTSGAGLPVMTARLPVDQPGIEIPSQQERQAVIHVREQGAWIAIERMLFVMPSVHQSTSYELAAPVTRIAGSRPHAAPRVALFSENGGELFIPTHGLMPLPMGLSDPSGVFLRDGRLVLWTRTNRSMGRFLVLAIGPAEWKLEDSCDTPSGSPVGMLPTSRPDEFASLQPGGEIEIWKVAVRR